MGFIPSSVCVTLLQTQHPGSGGLSPYFNDFTEMITIAENTLPAFQLHPPLPLSRYGVCFYFQSVRIRTAVKYGLILENSILYKLKSSK